ncbi:hypothetical protein V9T40_001377 [Parthenolecanium corni]|uniref:Cuticle protein n=1 Tax=Parthenolecanium corni TaxID=536013 RepID=A0AAN9TB29_9HEMI
MCATIATAVYAPPTYVSPYVSPAPAAYFAPAAKIAAVPAYAHPIKYAPIAYAAPKAAYDTEYDPNPSYSYAYDVQDHVTGDSKSQHESRQGDVVQGSYSLVEPDGSKRTVDYTADPHNGFNAVVHKEPSAYPAAAKAYAAPVPVAPVVKYAPAPTKYVLPAAKYAQPSVYAYAPAPAPLVAYAH